MQQPPVYQPQPQPGVVYPPQPQGQSGIVYTPQPQGQQIVYAQGANPQPVQTNYVIQNAPVQQQDGCCSGKSEKFNATGGLVTGVIQTIIGALSIILSGASYAFPLYWYSGYGIWSGIIFFLPAGILGILSKHRSTGVITAYLVWCILACLQTVGMIGYEGAAAGASAILTQSCSWVNDYYYSTDYTCSYDSGTGGVAIHSILAILALIEFIVSIVGAAMCCGGLRCCCATAPPAATTTTTTMYYPGQPQVVVQPQPAGQPANAMYPEAKI